MIEKQIINNQLYVWIIRYPHGKQLLYKRWLGYDYGMVMDRQPFIAKDVELIKSENNA